MTAAPFVLAQAQPTGFDPSFFIMMAVIGVVFYFFMIRPQARREKQRRAMIDALKKGDRIVTIGGIHGTIERVEDASILVKVDDAAKLRFDKAAIASVRDAQGA